MPWVTINVISGYDEGKIRMLHQNVAKAVYDTLDIPSEWVKIQILEMKDKDHSIGGVTIDELPKNENYRK